MQFVLEQDALLADAGLAVFAEEFQYFLVMILDSAAVWSHEELVDVFILKFVKLHELVMFEVSDVFVGVHALRAQQISTLKTEADRWKISFTGITTRRDLFRIFDGKEFQKTVEIEGVGEDFKRSTSWQVNVFSTLGALQRRPLWSFDGHFIETRKTEAVKTLKCLGVGEDF